MFSLYWPGTLVRGYPDSSRKAYLSRIAVMERTDLTPRRGGEGLPTHPRTAELAVASAATYASGLFMLSVAGREVRLEAALMVFGAAVIIAAVIFGLTIVVTAAEAVTGRAWASGFRRLRPSERTSGGVAVRALRYAAVLWMANGVALWFATFASLTLAG